MQFYLTLVKCDEHKLQGESEKDDKNLFWFKTANWKLDLTVQYRDNLFPNTFKIMFYHK